MTPEAAQSLDIARQHLAAADASIGIPIAFVAAREAYLAGYHAAMAYVLEMTGRRQRLIRDCEASLRAWRGPKLALTSGLLGFWLEHTR